MARYNKTKSSKYKSPNKDRFDTEKYNTTIYLKVPDVKGRRKICPFINLYID